MAGDDGIDEQILGPPGNSTLFIITSRMYMTMTDDETVLEHQFTVRESMGQKRRLPSHNKAINVKFKEIMYLRLCYST